MKESDLLDIIEKLAPKDCLNNDEQGGCIWCGGHPIGEKWGYATSNPEDHSADCPYIEARQELSKWGRGN